MQMIWLHQHRPVSAWYTLTADDQHRLLDRWQDLAKSVIGGRRVGVYSIRGQSEMERLEIWEFESLEAIERHWQTWLAAEYADWHVSSNMVGVPPAEVDPQVPS